MNKQIRLTLTNNVGTIIEQYDINTATDLPIQVQAIDGVYYQFTDLDTGIGPDSIITERVDNDLLISFDPGTDLVIENYFVQGQGALVGLQADGGFFSYPVTTASEHVLAEEIAASQAFTPDQPTLAPLAVLGAIGLTVGAISLLNDDDDDVIGPTP
ncbi:MAG: hypothetical protein Q4A74_09035, partial [Cardiobacteriaceae bacterium]|nr:hypothetical protein [Cardiobacteriaceae bacterium]